MWLLDIRVVAIVIAIVCALRFFRSLSTGEVPNQGRWSTGCTNRDEKPLQYWLNMAWIAFFGVLVLWGGFHYANQQAAKERSLHAKTPTNSAKISRWGQSNPPSPQRDSAH